MKKSIITAAAAFFCIFILVQPVFSQGQGRPGSAGRPGTQGSGAGMSGAFSDMDSAFEALEQETTLQDEYYLGRAVAANILGAYKPYTQNSELTQYLNRICQTLAINSSQPQIFSGYYVMILDSPEFNAFATPGGHIFITKGLVEAAPSEDALAAIIAHELSHIILKHGISIIDDMKLNEEMSSMANQAAAFAGRGNEGAQRALAFRNSVSGIIDTMLKNGYSRPQEFEADKSAIALLAASGYDPGGLLEILRVLQRVQQNQKGGFNSTHPTPADRITNAEQYSSGYRVPDTRSYRAPRYKNK